MLDILDHKTGKVVAVVLDNGTVVKKQGLTDEVEKLIKDQLAEKSEKNRKSKK